MKKLTIFHKANLVINKFEAKSSPTEWSS